LSTIIFLSAEDSLLSNSFWGDTHFKTDTMPDAQEHNKPYSSGFNDYCLNFALRSTAPDSRAGGGAPEMENRLSILATCGFGFRTSLEATNG